MSNHPPLTWGQVRSWAEANGITDDHLVTDQDGRAVRDLSESVYDSYRPGNEPCQGKPALVVQTRWG